MIPLDVTPISAPTATNSNAMGSLADMIAEIAFRNKKLAEDARQADMSNATNLEAVRGRNDYFGMEKDTHRMLAEDRSVARKEKDEAKQKQRLDFLQDAYRKAKTPAERQMILDQLRGHAASMNNSLEELPAEQTATDVAPTVEAPMGAKPGFTPFQVGKKAPKVNKGFAGALAAYMQSPEASASDAGAPNEVTQLSPVQEQQFQAWAKQNGIRDVDHPDSHYDYRGAFLAGVKPGPDAHWPDTFKQHGHETFSEESQYSKGPGDGGRWEGEKYVPGKSGGVNVSPFPWDRLGLPPPPAAEKPAAKGSGRFALKDKEGNLLQTFDTNSEADSVQQSIMAAAKERPGDTPDEKHASEMAMQRATALYPQVGAAKAADIYDQTYKAVMSEVKKRGVAGAGGSGGAAGPSKGELKQTAMDREEVHKIYSDFKGNYDPKTSIQAERRLRAAVEAIDKGGGMNELSALKDYMLSVSGKVVTDREMDQFLKSEGAWNKYESVMNQWTKGGEMPEDFKRALRGMLARNAETATRQRLEDAANAKNQAMLAGLSDSDVARVEGFFTGDYKAAPTVTPLRERGKAPAKSPSRPAAPSGGDATSDADLVNSWKNRAK